jgi:hypothetical protein
MLYSDALKKKVSSRCVSKHENQASEVTGLTKQAFCIHLLVLNHDELELLRQQAEKRNMILVQSRDDQRWNITS